VRGDPSLETRVAALRQEQTRREAEIAALAQQEEQARRILEQRQCEAIVAGLTSEIAVKRAECLESRSDYAACLAKNEAHSSNSGLLGALAGLAASVVTGGAAAPLVLAGAGVGYAGGKVSSSDCGGSPVCTPDEQVLRQDVLSSHHLPGTPTCGP
jgi:multidrug efflux pump subunit AcrA (membrane-fusion protein)